MLTEREFKQLKKAIGNNRGLRDDDFGNCTPDQDIFELLRSYVSDSDALAPAIMIADDFATLYEMSDVQRSHLIALIQAQYGR